MGLVCGVKFPMPAVSKGAFRSGKSPGCRELCKSVDRRESRRLMSQEMSDDFEQNNSERYDRHRQHGCRSALFQSCHRLEMRGNFGFDSQLSGLPDRIKIRQRGQCREEQNGYADDALIEESQRARQTEEPADAQGHC